jgi:NADPH-dependent curcumin reductase CurA
MLRVMNPFSPHHRVRTDLGHQRGRAVRREIPGLDPVNRIKMQGMIVFDWKDRYPEALQALAGYPRRGKTQIPRVGARRNRDGSTRAHRPAQGENFGKQLIKLA